MEPVVSAAETWGHPPLLTTPPEPVRPEGSAAQRGTRLLGVYTGYLVIGVIFGVIVVESGVRLPPSVPLLGGLLALLPLSWLHALVHEAGHAAAGRLARYRLLTFVVGPLQVRRVRDGLRFGRSRTVRYFGGYVYGTPLDTRNLRWRRFVFVAGGPLASILLLLLVGLAYDIALQRQPPWAGWLFIFAVLIFFSVVLTLVPLQIHGVSNDGHQLFKLLRGGPDLEENLALSLLSTALIGGVRPRDLDPALLERALATTRPQTAFGAHYLAYWRELDTGNASAAATHLDYVLANRKLALPPSRANFAIEAAYLVARHGNDPAAARAWLELGRDGIVPQENRCRAEAAVLLAEEQSAAAVAAAEDGLRHLEQSTDLGGAQAEREWLQSIRNDRAFAYCCRPFGRNHDSPRDDAGGDTAGRDRVATTHPHPPGCRPAHRSAGSRLGRAQRRHHRGLRERAVCHRSLSGHRRPGAG